VALKRLVNVLLAVAAGSAFVVSAAPAALAQPGNDDFANATVINSVPFSTTEDTSQATSDPGDPYQCSSNGSVWFAYTPPTAMTVRADTSGSNYDTVLSAWTGSQGALNFVGCDDDSAGNGASRLTLQLSGGTTYYFMVAFCCGSGLNGGGSLQFAVTQPTPPANDNFADATAVTALPADQTVDLSAATTQPSEPVPSCAGQAHNTVWYSFTPDTTESITASTNQYGVVAAIYTGASLATLNPVGCAPYYYQPVVFRAQANTTYYIQVGVWCCEGFGSVTLHLAVAPNPVAGFYFYPSEPSIYDAVGFQNNSYDPAGGSITSAAWNFGDGATATGFYPTHQYASDGDYTVRLTITTADGRTASTTQTVHVSTHDVAVVEVAVPNSAHPGQTIGIDARIRNNRYPETVRVDLLVSIPGGFNQVGTLTQLVPVRPPGGTSTRFPFSYTITPADVTIGKATFKAIATIVDHRDALPADNELLSPPVKIS
jgi:hypothetical protein